jgi:hypothetical protein
MRRHLTVLIAVLALALAACGNDDTEVATPGAGGDDPVAEAVCVAHDPALDAYLGLTLDEATEQAEGEGYTIRVLGEDAATAEDCYAATMDLREDRINIELAEGVVIAASIG